jgi:hypothetical protein
MPYAAAHGGDPADPRFAMRPRRWYTYEVVPPGRRAVKLTARLWRYRALVRRKRYDAAPYYGAASGRWRKKKRSWRI